MSIWNRTFFVQTAGVASLLLMVFATPALAISSLVVFGDSIVDQGNTQIAVIGGGGADPTPASAGYFEGRFTNGFNPADTLSFAIDGTEATGSLSGGTNFAFGGATARDDGEGVPDFEAQVGFYLDSLGGGAADSDSLFLINIGGNDIIDIAFAPPADAPGIIGDAVTSIVTGILSLQAAGAEDFLFVGVGDVGGIPLVPAAFSGAVRGATIALNTAIEDAITPLGVDFFDTIGLFDGITAAPELFGLPADIDLDTSCLTAGGGAAPPAGDPTCAGFAFFDDVHPTSAVLEILGNELVATVVPEPGTGLLLMLGLAGLGSTRRRHAA